MSTTVTNAKELAAAVNNKENRIVIEGRLGDIVIKINAVGPVAWGVAIGAIEVALFGIAATTGSAGTGTPIGIASECVAAPVLISALGSVSAATTAIGIAVAGGGVGVLSTMRRYSTARKNGRVVLTRR